MKKNIFMVLHIAGLIIIPIILSIVTISPFDSPPEVEPQEIQMPESKTNFDLLYFTLLIIWILLIIKVIIRIKQGTFNVRTI